MKKVLINVTAQAKAVRKICNQYKPSVANDRYMELLGRVPTILLTHKQAQA